MALIALTRFGGEQPRLSSRLLPAGGAQRAVNAKLWSGTLRAWKRPKLRATTAKAAPIKSIYRYRGGSKDLWLTFQQDVDVIRAPLAGDTFGRIFFTGLGKPKLADSRLVVSDYPVVGTFSIGASTISVATKEGIQASDLITIDYGAGVTQQLSVDTATVVSGNLQLVLAGTINHVADGTTRVSVATARWPTDYHDLGVPAPATKLTIEVDSGPGVTTGDIEAIRVYQLAALDYDSGESTFQTILNANKLKRSNNANWTPPNIDVTGANTIASSQLPMKTIETLTVNTDGTPVEVVVEAGITHFIYQSSSVDLRAEFYGEITADGLLLASHQQPFVLHNRFNEISGHGVKFKEVANLDPGSHIFRLACQWPTTFRIPDYDAAEYVRLINKMQVRYTNRMILRLNTGHGLVAGNRIKLTGIVRVNTEEPSIGQDLDGKEVNVVSVNPNGDPDEIVIDNVEPGGIYEIANAKWSQTVGQNQELSSRSYVYTYVATIQGQEFESAPSPPSDIVDAHDGQEVSLSAFINPTTLNYDSVFSALRIYRFVSGESTQGSYLFVAEIPINQATYDDTMLAKNLGEAVPSIGWDVPPDDLTGLIELPQGGAAAFTKKELCLAEPYFLHAWPTAYRRTTHDEIVAIGSFGSSIGVATKGRPAVLTGVDPLTMSMEHIEVIQPCLSKRGSVDMGYAFVYPSPDGLVMISTGRATVVTEALFTKDEWSALNPESFVAASFSDRYVCFFDTGTRKGGFILDPKNPEATLVFLDIWATDVWTDPQTGKLYICQLQQILEFDADVLELDYVWRSREYNVEGSMGVAMVDAAKYPVTFRVFGDGHLLHEQRVDTRDTFPIPDGIYSDWWVELEGQHEIKAVYVAERVEEIRQAIGG